MRDLARFFGSRKGRVVLFVLCGVQIIEWWTMWDMGVVPQFLLWVSIGVALGLLGIEGMDWKYQRMLKRQNAALMARIDAAYHVDRHTDD